MNRIATFVLLACLLPGALQPADAADAIRRFVLVAGANDGGTDRPALIFAQYGIESPTASEIFSAGAPRSAGMMACRNTSRVRGSFPVRTAARNRPAVAGML